MDIDDIDVELTDFIFEKPSRIIITESSGQGKSHFIEQLVKKHINKFYKIVLCGSPNRLLDFPETSSITTHHKSNTDPIYNPFTHLTQYQIKSKNKLQCLVIIDDLMQISYKSEVVSDIFSKGRHYNISCILSNQSFFPLGSGQSLYPQIKNNCTAFFFSRLDQIIRFPLFLDI